MAQAFAATLDGIRKARNRRLQTTDEFHLQPVVFRFRADVHFAFCECWKTLPNSLLR